MLRDGTRARSSVPHEVTGTGAPSPWTADIPSATHMHVGDGTEVPLRSAAGAGNQWSVERVAGEDVAEVEIRRGEPVVPEGTAPSTYGVPGPAVPVSSMTGLVSVRRVA